MTGLPIDRTNALVTIFAFACLCGHSFAQTNYDESKVPRYELPDPLVTLDGEKVTTVEQWNETRRPEIYKLFEEHMFGAMPPRPKALRFEVQSVDENALGGKAIRKEVRIYFDKASKYFVDLLIYQPKSDKPVPTFLTINFKGNHSISDDKGISITESWIRGGNNRASEEGRGIASSRWPVEMIVDRGYALATIYYGDVVPDYHDGFRNGIFPLLDRLDAEGVEHDEPVHAVDPRPADRTAAISAWAWGLSRVMDYLETDEAIDAKRVAVMGHSRLGKTSLWTGASDPRIAITISNNSGCGGAALSRRAFGETVKRINTSFPHWFCDNFKKYNSNEGKCPIDQHMLVALMAPRPVYIASAVEDRWADPRGEFLSGLHASPVYELHSLIGMPSKEMPSLNKPLSGTIGYHIRSGRHDVTDFDWRAYLDFADKHLGK